MLQDPSPLPFPLVRRRSAHNGLAVGHSCKRAHQSVATAPGSEYLKPGLSGSGVRWSVGLTDRRQPSYRWPGWVQGNAPLPYLHSCLWIGRRGSR